MSVETWKTIFEIGGVILLFFTFIFGAGVVFTSSRINKIQSEQLRQFDRDLTDAKTKLGTQQERAAKAEKELKEVDLKTEGFRLAIAEANERAGQANKEAGKANERAGNLEVTAATLTRTNLETAEKLHDAEKALEQEKKTRLEMEQSLTPRRLVVMINSRTRASDIDELKEFSGVDVIIDFLPEIEASRAARELAGVLKSAGWNVIKASPNAELNIDFFDGVVIFGPVTAPNSELTREQSETSERTSAAANTLIRYLSRKNWSDVKRLNAKVVADPTKADEGHIEVNRIRISVGLKPSPYFLPPEIKEADAEMKRRLQEIQADTNRKIREHLDEQERLRKNPPK